MTTCNWMATILTGMAILGYCRGTAQAESTALAPTASSVPAPYSESAPGAPLNLGDQRYLFVDPAGLERFEHVQFTVNPPVARQVVLRNDNPWEDMAGYSNVIDDGSGVYKMYYLNTVVLDPTFRCNVALATSTDGIHWEKPNLGQIEFAGSKDNNIVMKNVGTGSAYYDTHEKNPEHRYKYLTNYPVDDKPDTPTTEGLVLYTSPDGIRWVKQEFQVYPYMQDSQAVMFYDPYIQKYVCYFRGNSNTTGFEDSSNPAGFRLGRESRGRHVMRGETDDPLKPWPYTHNPRPFYGGDHELPYMDDVELPIALARDDQDPPDADLYGNQVFLYPWAHRVYFAFPTCYYHYNDERAYLSPNHEDRNVGVGECQLAVSRDGKTWTRYRRPAYLKHGWWGDHYAYWPWVFQGMIRRGDKIYQYAELRGSGHGAIRFIEGSDGSLGGVALLEQSADRFVAAEFDYTGGRIVTEPIVFKGNRLVLNVDTGAMGEGRVALLTADGAPIPGFTIEESDILNGDWKSKQVAWLRGMEEVPPPPDKPEQKPRTARKSSGDVSALAGQPIRLQFDMRGARLYAMQFITE